MSTPVTLTGRIGAPPELKFGQSGKAVATFSVVTDRRQLNKQTNEWESTSTTWWRCVAFGDLAENLCDSLDKGSAVLVTGRVEEETWNDKNTGAKRSAMKVVVEEIGPSLKYATAKVTKASRSGGTQRDGGNRSSAGQNSNSRPQQNSNSSGWGGQSAGGGWGGGEWSGSNEQPPF